MRTAVKPKHLLNFLEGSDIFAYGLYLSCQHMPSTGLLGFVTPNTNRAGIHIDAGRLKLRTMQSLDVTAVAWILMRTSSRLGAGVSSSLS